jgi:ATP-dependent exoDNAse (exonuclease V) beta subunit
MDLNKPLQIRDASAGSGKTYSLVQHYLKLLLQENDQRAELGQIIAMTFTNKAALEMKTRILEDLGKLSGNNPEHQKFLEETAAFVGIPAEKIKQNSQLVLRKLLHQYEEFNVMTIDKFNLRLIRTFSRDLNLPEQFDILIQKNELLERCLNELLLQVDAREKTELQRLAINFGKEKLYEEGSWNIKQELKKKSKYILNEKELNLVDALVKTEQSIEDEAKLRAKYNEKLQEYYRMGKAIPEAYAQSGLTVNQLAGKSNLEKAILKFNSIDEIGVNDGLLDFTDSALGNLEKTAEITDFSLVKNTYERYKRWLNENGKELTELHLIQKQLTSTKMLREFAVYVNNLRKREATILVAEFNQLVSELVKNEEAPFIYERLGNKFRHFFLDEFQDTSFLQWQNLIPLVHESISHNQFNFVVGDPKQSIYRFKNGIADQFIELPGIYNPENEPSIALKSKYFNLQGNKGSLTDNWRSAKEIVHFNNSFFLKLKELLPENGKRFFSSVEQNPKGKEGGYVKIEFSPSNKEITTEENQEDEDSTTNQRKCVEYVKEAIAEGYSPGDICVLALKSKACLEMATALKKEGFQVVSADSLSVNAEATVRMLIHFLGWRLRPTDQKKAALFAYHYFDFKFPDKGFSQYIQCFSSEIGFFSIEKFYELSGIPENSWMSPFTSIYSCLEEILDLTSIDKTKNVYVKQLMDLAFDYDKRNGPNLQDFLSFYKDKGKDTNVQIAENDQAIKVMTAHKSKGLEFPVVIIPILDNASKRTSELLCKNDDYFFEVTASDRTLGKGISVTAIQKELEDQLMDAVNLLYVQFTRAIDRLYVYNEYKVVKKETPLEQKTVIPFDKAIKSLVESFEGAVVSENGILLEYGRKPEISVKKKDNTRYYPIESLEGKLWFPEISLREKFEKETEGYTEQIRLGKQFHWIMERSVNYEDSLIQLEEGLINGFCEAKHEALLKEMLSNFYNHELTKAILENGISLNERTLIVDEMKRLRPDKIVQLKDKFVIIDFKTGEELPKHHSQVQEYASVLKKMGKTEIEGYLYYSNQSEYNKVTI